MGTGGKGERGGEGQRGGDGRGQRGGRGRCREGRGGGQQRLGGTLCLIFQGTCTCTDTRFTELLVC